MNYTQIQLNFLKKQRNIYEEAELFEQNRNEIGTRLEILANPNNPSQSLVLKEGKLYNKENTEVFNVRDNVVDFCKNEFETTAKEWAKLNKQFLNYHKSLDVYTLINSIPLVNFLAERTGLGDLKNATVIDVGAGTGHTFASFFRNPQSLDYYLCDPNLRLLHDQFLRIYPALSKYKLTHLLSYAEKLPFKNEVADLVMSLSSIDHFNDYKAFFKDAYRVVKKGGKVFVASHLDEPNMEEMVRPSFLSKLFSFSFFENLTRKLYYKKYKVGSDDHTNHFHSIEPIESAMNIAGFKTIGKEEYLGNFWIVGEK